VKTTCFRILKANGWLAVLLKRRYERYYIDCIATSIMLSIYMELIAKIGKLVPNTVGNFGEECVLHATADN
jgi:hypothetical protein